NKIFSSKATPAASMESIVDLVQAEIDKQFAETETN
ncbi:MAG: hypothetical protein K0S55_1235, partial [Clostridia bacterium]|nr:hypothetical protein [Clostridia bacterium]